MKVIIIIPAHNEEASISSTVTTIIKSGYDYIVVNDGSTDRTAQVLSANNFAHIDLPFNLGIGGAVQTGYKYALEHNYDIAIQFDADGQHDADSIPSIISPIESHQADLVIGSRFIKKSSANFKSSFLRRTGIKLISSIIYLLSQKRIYDTTSGFRAAGRKAITYFASNYPHEYPEPISDYELIKLKYKVLEVPAKMHERSAGKSSIHSWKSAYYVVNVILSILIIKLRKEPK